MAIKLEEVTTDITLELDEEVISIADYKKASDSFLDLVKELSKSIADTKVSESDWQVKVYAGSIGVGVLPSPTNVYADQVRMAMVDGIKSLSKGIRPIEFTDKAIGHAKSLASLFKKAGITKPNVRIWSKREESVDMDRTIATNADSLLESSYEEDGSVDGILERLDAHGTLGFVVYDVIDERAVRCEISEADIPLALKSFRERIEVIGKVKYRKDGMPVSIQASKIINFPKKSEIPSLTEMRNMLNGIAA
jgi:hypothetical protein